MQFGLKFTFSPNHAKADAFANLLLGSTGLGSLASAYADHPHIGAVLMGIGLLIKGFVTFTAEDDTKQ